MIYLQYNTFVTSKANTPLEECEDYAACDPKLGRFVVCDGATTTSYSREWAKLLGEHFVKTFGENNKPDQAIGQDDKPDRIVGQDNIEDWLMPVQEEWHKQIPWQKLDYFCRTKANQGACSTLAGISLDRPESMDNRWAWQEIPHVHVDVVGDSCVILIRDGKLYQSVPYTSSGEFNGPPYAICSIPKNNRYLSEYWKRFVFESQADDIWLLATDALAAFCIKSREDGHWDEIQKRLLKIVLSSWESSELQESCREEFAEYIQELRKKKEIRNDDVAMVIARFTR